MASHAYVAFDLGAESGRSMLAILQSGKLTLTQTHRFPNIPRRLPSGLHWSLSDLWGQLLEGLKRSSIAADEAGVKLVSLGVDTWGVDFALVGKSGQLLGLPFAYRDERNAPAMRAAFRKVSAKDIYAATGIQFLPFNTLYQLLAQHKAEPALLGQTHRMLMMPDLLHYFFSGQMVNEATIASTTQMVDPRTGRWHKKLMQQMGLPGGMLGKIVPAGTAIGMLSQHIAGDLGIKPMQVIVPGSHDTASAVAAVPLDARFKGGWAFLSSGTWSLIGAELDKPIVTPASQQAGFTNERGVGITIRFLKNIAGLWLVQECRRDLQKQGEELSYAQLTTLAEKSEPFRTLLDTSHAPFMSPGNMRAKIDAFARATGQPVPRTAGEYVRACLESLALTYRDALDTLESLLGRTIDRLHIVGGGGQNALLNQMTADATGKQVIIGPYEATAIGNALTQAMGAGHVRDLSHLRKIVASSFDLQTCQPRQSQAYQSQLARFQAIKAK